MQGSSYVTTAGLLMTATVTSSTEPLNNCDWKLSDCKDPNNWTHKDFYTNCHKDINDEVGLCSAACGQFPNDVLCTRYCKDWGKTCRSRTTQAPLTPTAKSTVLSTTDRPHTTADDGSTVITPLISIAMSEVVTGKSTTNQLDMTTVREILITSKEPESIKATQTTAILQEKSFEDNVWIAIPILAVVTALAICTAAIFAYKCYQERKYLKRRNDIEGANRDLVKTDELEMNGTRNGQPAANGEEGVHAGTSTNQSRAAFPNGESPVAVLMKQLIDVQDFSAYQRLLPSFLQYIDHWENKEPVYWRNVAQEWNRRRTEQPQSSFHRFSFQRSHSNQSYTATEEITAGDEQNEHREDAENRRLLDHADSTTQEGPKVTIDEKDLVLMDIKEMILSRNQSSDTQFDR